MRGTRLKVSGRSLDFNNHVTPRPGLRQGSEIYVSQYAAVKRKVTAGGQQPESVIPQCGTAAEV